MTPIDTYLTKVNEVQKPEMERVHKLIKRIVPDAEEVISYGMPAFKYKKKYLIGFCDFKDHLSIFPGSNAIAEMKDDLKAFKTSKGTIQFTVEDPISDALLTKIVKHCVSNIDESY